MWACVVPVYEPGEESLKLTVNFHRPVVRVDRELKRSTASRYVDMMPWTPFNHFQKNFHKFFHKLFQIIFRIFVRNFFRNFFINFFIIFFTNFSGIFSQIFSQIFSINVFTIFFSSFVPLPMCTFNTIVLWTEHWITHSLHFYNTIQWRSRRQPVTAKPPMCNVLIWVPPCRIHPSTEGVDAAQTRGYTGSQSCHQGCCFQPSPANSAIWHQVGSAESAGSSCVLKIRDGWRKYMDDIFKL